MFTVHLKTYGCQMNARDSEMLAALLERRGMAIAPRERGADAVVLNTCSVRSKAEDKAIGKARLLIARKPRPDRIVGLVGCLVQRLQEGVFERVPGLDFGVGTHRLAAVPAVIEAVRAGRRPLLVADAAAREPYDGQTHRPGGVTAFVNVLFGCNRRCAYCVVPDVRGSEWSRPAADVIEEVRALAAGGVREVTLLGQSIMAYGRANPAWPASAASSPRGFREPLPRLLEAVSGVPGIVRVRFTSGHPAGCTDELARAMAELPAVCEHLHLPVQSGADRVLARMGRGYTADAYRAAVRRLRAAVPDLALSTDVIVGFPGETPAEFEQTRALLEEIGVDQTFVFKYDPRPGTPAAGWPDDVCAADKLRRNHLLLEDQVRRSAALHRAWIGREVEVLAEGRSRRVAARWAGRTRQNVQAVFAAPAGLRPGDRVHLRVGQATAQALYGTIVHIEQGMSNDS